MYLYLYKSVLDYFAKSNKTHPVNHYIQDEAELLNIRTF